MNMKPMKPPLLPLILPQNSTATSVCSFFSSLAVYVQPLHFNHKKETQYRNVMFKVTIESQAQETLIYVTYSKTCQKYHLDTCWPQIQILLEKRDNFRRTKIQAFL